MSAPRDASRGGVGRALLWARVGHLSAGGMAPVHGPASGTIESAACRFTLTFLDDNKLCLYFHFAVGGPHAVRAACREMDANKFGRMARALREWDPSDGAMVSSSSLQESENQRRHVFNDACEHVLGRRPKQMQSAAATSVDGSRPTSSASTASTSQPKAREHDRPSPASKQIPKRSCQHRLQQRELELSFASSSSSISGGEEIKISGEEVTISDATFYLQLCSDRCTFFPSFRLHVQNRLSSDSERFPAACACLESSSLCSDRLSYC